MSARLNPASIKNKNKREDVARKQKKEKGQRKLQRRLELAKLEANDPLAKKKRQSENVPRTLDNSREFDPSILPTDPTTTSTEQQEELAADLDSDPYASYFTATEDPTIPPKVLITTSHKASRLTYDFCDEIVGVFPGAEFIRRKKGKGFEIGWIAAWAGTRGYKHLIVVNEDMRRPNGVTVIYLPNGPSAYFKLTSIQLTKQIFGHARATPHNPELVLNGFTTRLGHTVGRMFQTAFPQLPEFEGRQVVTLHNQRDFIFFRRHRYAFRSTEKVALQEIGPRFTLKLKWIKKAIPAVHNLGAHPKSMNFDFDVGEDQEQDGPIEKEGKGSVDGGISSTMSEQTKVAPPTQDEFLWLWKAELETTRRTFFL